MGGLDRRVSAVTYKLLSGFVSSISSPRKGGHGGDGTGLGLAAVWPL